MEKMRIILKRLMERAGHNPYDIQRLTGLPAATTYRFLDKKIDQPKLDSIKAWAKAYGVTEPQLRGDVPIDGVDSPSDPPDLKNLLTLPEYKHISNLKRIGEEKRIMLFRMAEMLAETQSEYSSTFHQTEQVVDRRKVNIFPNAGMRVGDRVYKNPPRQKRRTEKNNTNERKYSSARSA